METPTFLAQSTLCLAKTANGYVIAPEAKSAPEQCLFFADLDALAAYLKASWTR